MPKENLFEKFDTILGFNKHRLIQGDRYHGKECAFVKCALEKIKINQQYFEHIVNHGDYGNNPPYVTDDEMQIVMTVIQWLGTPVGQAFIQDAEAIESSQKYKD